MTEDKDQKTSTEKPLTLRSDKLSLKKPAAGDSGQIRQSFSHGRTKTVTVEVKRRRAGPVVAAPSAPELESPAQVDKAVEQLSQLAQEEVQNLTSSERNTRLRALHEAMAHNDEERRLTEIQRLEEEAVARKQEREEQARLQEEAKIQKTQEEPESPTELSASPPAAQPVSPSPNFPARPAGKPAHWVEEDEEVAKANKLKAQKSLERRDREEGLKRSGRYVVITKTEDDEAEPAQRSTVRRRQKTKHRPSVPAAKILREVILPEVITVQELANRMAERTALVIKTLMNMGIMATVTQTIDADTAELVINELGHKVKRVAESDVEQGLGDLLTEQEEDLKPRAPVVTIMGHVDHGKTSLLDALRLTDVVSGEAGGITQHIGAYQVTLESGKKITFLDTPGHEAFTAMRARGAQATDIVVLVVAADDGVQPQTIEAIRHAKAAGVPIIVAINKIDKPGADPSTVRNELLAHEIQVESYGGDVLEVEVSAKQKIGLDKLEDAILLQSEILELKANPNRSATGVVIESKLDTGRGTVATILVQKGTIRVGDICVVGSEWGRVRALGDDHGRSLKEAGPSIPVTVLGLQGSPEAGDDLVVVASESRAREIAEYRQRKKRDQRTSLVQKSSLEEIFAGLAEGRAKELPIIIKADVQGSVEAIVASLQKMATDEVTVTVMHAGVGAISESDISLAQTSGALVIGFNVRANSQAKDLAQREGIDIRYYAIIYEIIDDVKALLSGMLKPELQENFLGYAEIREVFNVTKVGKIAGCRVTDGVVKRGARVRLLRDNVVIHDGALKTLKHFKDEVKEVKSGFECGMAFESYQDIQVGDMIECYEINEIKRKLA